MASYPEIDLSQTAHAELSSDVDQECDLDAVGLLQRDGVERASSSGGLAGEWLSDLAQSRVEQGQDWTGGQLVDSSSAGRHVVQRPLVIALYQLGFRTLQEGLDEAGHELRGGVHDVGVEEYDQVGGGRSDPGAHGLSLAARAVQVDDAGAVVIGDRGRVVDGVVVDDDEFIDEFTVGERGVQDCADGGRLISRRDDHRDGRRRLEVDHALETEFVAAKSPRDVWAAHS